MKLKFKIILIFAGIFLTANVSASALKITPSSVHLEGVSGKTEQKIITIENPGSDVALFEVYIDDFSDWISVNPTSFTLNPGEKREVLISANSRNQGIYATALSVVSKPLSSRKLQANAGAKVPLEIKINASPSRISLLASVGQNLKIIFSKNNFAFLLIGAGLIAAFWYFSARKGSKNS
jgi:hypothetical protein